MSHEIVIYTDGSALGNPGKAGYGFLIWDKKNNHVEEHGKHREHATNNQMELMAFLESLKWLNENVSGKTVSIHLDSEYVKNGITSWIKNWKKNGWKTAAKKPVLNKEIWQDIDTAYEKAININDIDLKYVPGHSGIWGNEAVDYIARTLAENQTMDLYKGDEDGFEKLRGLKIK